MRRGRPPVGLACPACGSALVAADPGGSDVLRVRCPACGGQFRARRRPEPARGDPGPPPVGGFGLAVRGGLLRALPWVYRLGLFAGSATLIALGGFVPLLRRWLGDSIRGYAGVVGAVGGIAVSSPTRDPDADLGPPLKRADAPSLFDEVADVARRLGVRPPEEIRLAFLPCCGVVAWRKGRALLLGLPLLDVLSRLELRAVLAHELAHLARGDATWSARSLRFVEDLGRALDDPAGRSWGPLRAWAGLCRGVAARLVGPISRGQEARADRAAAAVAGGRAAASSLVKVAIVQPLFRELLDHLGPARAGSVNLYAAFRDLWDRLPPPLIDAMRLRLLTVVEGSPASPHPPLPDRVAALLEYPEGAEVGPDDRRAVALLADPDWLEEMLHERLFANAAIEPSIFHKAGT